MAITAKVNTPPEANGKVTNSSASKTVGTQNASKVLDNFTIKASDIPITLDNSSAANVQDALNESVLITTTQTLTNKTLTSPVINTGISGTAILDEDNMASNSATKLATQQSIKSYVDTSVNTELVQDIVGAMFTSNTETNIEVDYQDGDGTIDLVATGSIDLTGTISGNDFARFTDTNTLQGLSVAETKSALGISDNEIIDWTSDQGSTNIHAGNYTDTNTTYSVQDGELSQNNFTNADHSKLNAIEASATADQSNAEIRTAVEAASDSNVFTDSDHVKLNAIESSATADQSNAEIVAAVEAGSDSNTFTDADHSKLNAIEASADVTDTANVTSSGALMDSELTDLAGVKGVTISTLQAKPSEGAFANGDKTKLDAIEASADVTDTTNVTSAGALMDSELTSIANVKALNQSVVSGATPTFTTTNFTDASNKRLMTDAQETKLDSVESNADITDTTNVTSSGALMDSELAGIAAIKATTGTFLSADESKLDGIEASATADQTNAEIRTLVESASDSNVFNDADHSKLNAIAASANNYTLPLLDEDDMASDSATSVASQQSVKAYVNTIVDGAPGTLDTLNELAAALGDDANYAATTSTAIGLRALKSNNLSDLANAGTARSNLGLGALAVLGTVNAATITDNSVGADELNVSGDGSSSQFLRSDGDGTFTWVTPTDTNTQLSTAQVQTIVGAMFSSNTETRIGVTYQSGDGTIDLVVDDMTANTNTQLSTEQVQDIAGPLVATNGTKTGIAVTYDDVNGDMDFVVDHDAATNFVANEHIDWTGASAGTIHASNYTNTGNTTYSAGAGIDLNTTTFSHTDTSSQSSVDGSGRTYIQDITLDTYGHVTGLATATETVTDTNTQLSTEQVQDIVGGMFTSNTETRIAATYEDGDGTIDLVVTDMTANDNTTYLGGTGLTLSSTTFNVDAAQTQITAVGTIATGVWNGTAIASAYLDADTAHLSTTQTFSGAKTFSSLASFTMDGNTITGVDDSGEFTDDDAHIMTSAAVQDKILGYGYTSGAVTAVGNGADNRIATFSSSTALYGESNLTYNGSTLQLSSAGNIEIGSGGANTAYIDLISDGTYTDYGARFIRWAGVNSTTDLVHRGTGDMRFITSEAANILWLTGGAEKMRMVHSNGRLGIGTNSPAEKLHVAGNIKADTSVKIGSNSNFDTSQLKVGDGTRDIRLNANHGSKAAVGTVGSHDFNFITANTIRATVDSGGNFGIGTEAPASWLDVSKDNSNSGNQFMVADTEGASAAVRTYSTSSPAGLILNHYYAVGGSPYMRYADFVANVGSGAATTMRFITKNSSNTYFTTTINDAGKLTTAGLILPASHSADKITMYAGGNEKIGTEANTLLFTGANFKFKDTSGNANLTFDGTDLKLIGDDKEMRWGAGGDFKIYVSSDDAYLKNVTQDKDIRFQVNDGGSNITALKIDASDGGTATFNHDIFLNTELGAIRFGASQQGSIYEHASDIIISNSAAGNDTVFENLNSAGSEYVKNIFIDGSTSRVGIGTVSPGEKLHVVGNSIISGSGDTTLFIQGAGNGHTSGSLVFQGSDDDASYRGTGVFNHDAASDIEYFSGTLYANDAWAVCRKTSTASHDASIAQGANALFIIEGGGDVGIGLSNPTQKLQVTGHIKATDGYQFLGDSTSGVLSTGSWYGDLGSNGFERVAGLSHDGGEFVIVEKGGRVSTLVDGNYFAYESGNGTGGGFFSSTSSSYANAPGIRASAASELYVVQWDNGASNLTVSGDIMANSGNVQSAAGVDLELRRGTNDDDRVSVQASETKIIGDTVERVRFGSYGIRVNYSGSAGTPPYSFVSDTNTGMFHPGADTIGFTTAGSENFRVTTGGAITYGTHEISGALSVNYGATINETAQNSDFRVESVNDPHMFRVDADANKIGIRISNPQQTLHVFTGEGGVGAKHATIRLGGYSTVGADIAAFRHTGNSNDQGLIFSGYHNSNGTTDTLSIDSLGKVGIGTIAQDDYNSNGDDFVIYGTGDTGMSIASGTSSNGSIMFADGTGGTAGYRGAIKYNHGSDYMHFNTAAAERMRIDSAGNVGIGEASPGTLLHFGAAPDARVITFDQSGRYSGIGTYFSSGATDSRIDFFLSDGGTNNDTNQEFAMYSSGNFHADADVIAYSSSVGSDIKLKKNVEDIGYGLDDVLKMRAVEFDWKEKRQGKHDIGVIAQELEKIIPEVVQEVDTLKTDGETHKVVDYAKLTSVLIKAIQQQQEEIELLKANYDDLKYNRR